MEKGLANGERLPAIMMASCRSSVSSESIRIGRVDLVNRISPIRNNAITPFLAGPRNADSLSTVKELEWKGAGQRDGKVDESAYR
jgi:hypothetical protein